jgi:hypothetical protein
MLQYNYRVSLPWVVVAFAAAPMLGSDNNPTP